MGWYAGKVAIGNVGAIKSDPGQLACLRSLCATHSAVISCCEVANDMLGRGASLRSMRMRVLVLGLSLRANELEVSWRVDLS